MGQMARFTIGALALLIAYYILARLQRQWTRQRKMQQLGCEEPPCYPHADPLFGWDLFIDNVKAIRQKRFLANLKKRVDTYGQTYSCLAMGREAFFTNDPKNLQAVHGLRFEDYGVEPIRAEASIPFIGRGVFNTDGRFWQHSRALIRPTFTRANVANLPAFEVHFQKLLKLIPIDGSTVDLKPSMYKLFLDTSTEFLFGESMHTLDPETPFQTVEFLKAFHYAQFGMGVRVRMGRLRFLHRDRKWNDSIKVVHDFASKYVDIALKRREEYLSDKERSEEDGIDGPQRRHVLLHEMAKETGAPDELRSQIIQVFLAGHDSSAITIVNAMLHLCRCPEKWNKLRKEVLSYSELTFETLKEMHYLQFIVKETLRLHPVAPTDARIALRDSVLPTGGGKDGTSPVLVTAGQIVVSSTHALHRRPEHWGSEDVEAFVPERWETCRPGWHYQPFGGGPRMCPGQNLALTETAYVIARFAQEWREIVCKDDTWEWVEEMKITASSANGCKLMVVPDDH